MRPKIIVVDDDPAVADTICELLLVSGFHACAVDAASSLTDEALGQAALIITDVKMPNVDGVILTRRIRSRYPFMPIIFLTGDLESAKRNDLLHELDASTVLLAKPPAVPHLVTAIRNLLGRD